MRAQLRILTLVLFTFAIEPSSSFGALCEPGSFSATGEDPCTLCPAGTFAGSAGQTACSPCEAGSFSGTGQSSCTQCPAGTFNDQLGQAMCSPCEAGTLSGSGQSSCTQRPAGTFNDQLGQAMCSPCEAGTFSGSGQSSCTDCAAGTFSSNPGQAECMPCVAGTFASSVGQSACTSCTATCADGSFESAACTATSDTVCTSCDASCATCTGAGSTDCTACSTGEPPLEGTCAAGCDVAPATGCLPPAFPGRAKLILKDSSPGKDLVKRKWAKGSAVDLTDLGDPTTSDAYFLCIYDAGERVSSTALPAGGTCAGKPCWAATETGFRYKDKDRTPDGAQVAKLKAGAAGKAGATVVGKGANLETPNPSSFTGPILVQLQRAGTGVCFEATYSAPFKKNADGKFVDSSD